MEDTRLMEYINSGYGSQSWMNAVELRKYVADPVYIPGDMRTLKIYHTSLESHRKLDSLIGS
jgi:hypothetical protein